MVHILTKCIQKYCSYYIMRAEYRCDDEVKIASYNFPVLKAHRSVL